MKKIIGFILLALFTFTLAACDGGSDNIDDILNCIDTPDAEGCIEDVIDDPTDDRTVEEIAADLLLENWDGDLSHIDALIESLDFSNSIEVVTEAYIEVEDYYGEISVLRQVVTDDFVYADSGTMIHRNIALNIDGELMEFDMVLEETDTGVIVYFEVGYIINILRLEDEEAADTFDAMGLSDQWLMFKFDDSLDNLIELEVLKDMMVDAFFQEFGATFFVDLEELALDEIGLTPALVGSDLDGFVMDIIAGDFDAAQIKFEAVDYDMILTGIDETFVIPEIVAELSDPVVIADLNALGLIDVPGVVTALQASGTLDYLETADPADVAILIDYFIDQDNMQDPDLSAMFLAYSEGTLDHYLMMMFLDEIYFDLQEIPGLDVDGLYDAMDLLDYDAWYMEYVDGEALAIAVYEGQDSFDSFIVDLAISAPESAAILANFSGVVLELEQYMIAVDDFNYAFENLNMFEQYFTFDYYMDLDFADLSIDKTDDFEIETTITLGNSAYADLFNDVLNDVYFYLDGFESFDLPYIENINCPVGDDCVAFDEYDEIITNLGLLDDMEIKVLFDPTDMDSISYDVNFTDFMNALMGIDPMTEASTVNDMYFRVTVNEGADVVIPTNTFDMNQFAEDAAKVALVVRTYQMLEDIGYYYSVHEAELPTDLFHQRALSTFDGFINDNPAFDLTMSYVGVTGSVLSYDYEIQLYWHDGTKVFESPLLLSAILPMLDEGMGAPTNAEFMNLVAMVDDANFNMTKLLLVFMLDVEPDFPTEEPY